MFKKVLFGFIAFCCLSNTYQAFGQDKMIDEIVAVVGSNIILKSDIEEMYMDYQAQGIALDGDVKCSILEDFLVDKLLLAEAELDTTIFVTDSQINQSLNERMEYYLENLGSEEAVERYFKQSIPEIKSELEEMIHNSLLTNQMQSKISGDISVSPAEVRYFYRNIDDEEAPLISEQVEYAEISIYPAIELERINEIKARLREFKKRIEDGESFSTLAVLYSEDGSSANGGEIGYMGRGQLVPPYATAAFNLKGDKISNVVESEYGYHIIQLIDKKNEKVNTRHILMKPKPSPEALEDASMRLDSLTTIIRKDLITFERAAFLYSGDKDTRNGGGISINPNTLSSKWKMDELDPNVSKELDELKVNEISEPFITTDSKNQTVYKVVKLINRIDEHRANIQEDYQTISDLYLSKKQTEIFSDWILERLDKTYIHLDESYANCNFNFEGWIK